MERKAMNAVNIYLKQKAGPIKPMNAVNNGPKLDTKEQTSGNFHFYKKARIPYARTHDAALYAGYGGAHVADISALFPDFDADPTDPESYDFDLTDDYLQSIIDAGTQVFFRLGQSIEHTIKNTEHSPLPISKNGRKSASIL